MKRIMLGIWACLYFITIAVLGFNKYDFLLLGIMWLGWYGLPLWHDVQIRQLEAESACINRYIDLLLGDR